MTENTLYEETISAVKTILMQKYDLNTDEAEKAVKNSPLKQIFQQDAEIAAHTSCEYWAKKIITLILKKSLDKN